MKYLAGDSLVFLQGDQESLLKQRFKSAEEEAAKGASEPVGYYLQSVNA